jgi:hypothetical protein
MTSNLYTTTTATSALSRKTHTKETSETPGAHAQKHLKRLLVRIGETLKLLMSTSVVGQWWLVWVSGAQQWVLGSSKGANAASLAIFDHVSLLAILDAWHGTPMLYRA